MEPGARGKNPRKAPNYFLRRLLVVIILLGIVALFFYGPTREFVKTTVLLGMPALVVWSYRRRFIRFSWTWWVSTIILLTLIAGYVFMLLGLPERIAVKSIEREAGIYLVQGKYDQAIEKYRELERYDRKDRMERKIAEVERQKAYHAAYQQARQMVIDGNYTEARRILGEIPFDAIVYPQVQELLRDLEKD
ncbi:MAG: hypothetical protein GXY92_06020 [Syntrophomonadaceae bacterium]|mgnify:CR=1 FL=1|nr:hypothetical protein [Syntrophomonadaceae bacterium]